MATAGHDLLELLLRECARTAPEPLYPSQFAAATSVPRPEIEQGLEHLRLGGLLRLTDWMQGRGQGYTVTTEGAELAGSPRLLDRLRRDGVAQQAAPPLRPAADVRASSWERGEAVRQILLEPRRPVVTLGLIFLNLLVFLTGLSISVQRKIPFNSYLAMQPDKQVSEVLRDVGALTYVDVVARDQWWRLLSHTFVHIGLLHLILNMYFLFSIGPMVENLWGPVRYLGLYLTAGLGGGCATILFLAVFKAHPLMMTANFAGASGALCGLFAALIIWVVSNRLHLPPALAAAWMRNLLVNAVLIIIISFVPGVGWQGHLGGALAGGAFALPSLWERYHRGRRRWLGLAGMLLVPALCAASVFVAVPPQERLRVLWPEVLHSLRQADDYARAYLKNADEFPNDKETVQDALAQFERSRRLLERTRDVLERSPPPEKNRDVIRNVKECVAEWISFLDSLEGLLQRRREPTAQLLGQLVDQRSALITRTNELNESLF